jgi:hypothetical protein
MTFGPRCYPQGRSKADRALPSLNDAAADVAWEALKRRIQSES